MPLCTVHLLSLRSHSSDSLTTFLSAVQSSNIQPLVISQVVRWIILPTSLSTDALLARNIHWDLLLILPSTSTLSEPLIRLVQYQWSVTAGIPSRLLADFTGRNGKLLHPNSSSVPALSGTLDKPRIANSAQGLELSPELMSWIQNLSSSSDVEGKGAVSMLNLLSFKPGMKDSYLEYGKAFAETIGSKRGGNAKIVGSVVDVDGNKESGWDEIALAHYPSILHFADMLASEDYQEVNHKFRLPALRDTFILCTSEIAVEEIMGKGRSVSSKL